jgi:hypothetical protein
MFKRLVKFYEAPYIAAQLYKGASWTLKESLVTHYENNSLTKNVRFVGFKNTFSYIDKGTRKIS